MIQFPIEWSSRSSQLLSDRILNSIQCNCKDTCLKIRDLKKSNKKKAQKFRRYMELLIVLNKNHYSIAFS